MKAKLKATRMQGRAADQGAPGGNRLLLAGSRARALKHRRIAGPAQRVLGERLPGERLEGIDETVDRARSRSAVLHADVTRHAAMPGPQQAGSAPGAPRSALPAPAAARPRAEATPRSAAADPGSEMSPRRAVRHLDDQALVTDLLARVHLIEGLHLAGRHPVLGEHLDPLGHAALAESLLDQLCQLLAVGHAALVAHVGR